jgi:amino acid transporter
MALPVFAADPLSSLAYATPAMMLALAAGGSGALGLLTPLSTVIALLLVLVVVTSRHTVRAYSQGGGAYRVARDNLGDRVGLVAAAAQLTDLVVTVTVATAAAGAALAPLFPGLGDAPVATALGLLAVVAVANLRGVREIGALFAAPVWLFAGAVVVVLIVGGVRCGLGVGGCPTADAAGAGSGLAAASPGGLSVLVGLRALVAGGVALTGLQRVTSGVSAFRYPQAAGATATLAVAGGLTAAGLIGMGALAQATQAQAGAAAQHPVLAQVTSALLGQGVGLAVVQLATAAVLVLAANTALADFPRLASVLAADGWLPRRMAARGDRMGFSAGLLTVTAAAAVLLIAAGASVTALVPLYVVAVFVVLTCSQAGMVSYWWQRGPRARERRRAWLAASGAVVTAAVATLAVVTGAGQGTWVVVVALAALIAAMAGVRRHDRDVATRLTIEVEEAGQPRAHDALLVVDRIDEPAARALSWVLGTNPRSVAALGVPIAGADLAERWAQLSGGLPLTTVAEAAERHATDKLVAAVAARRQPGRATTVVLPEELARSWADQLRRHRLDLALKAQLRRLERVAVADLTSPSGGPGPYTVEEPAEHHVLVLVSGVHAGARVALSYAKLLGPTSLRALSVGIDPNASARLLADWQERGLSVPLEVVASPFRSLAEGVRRSVRRCAPDGRHTVVTCVLPELIGLPAWAQPLHGRSAETVRSALLFERGVVTIALPYRLPGPPRPTDRSQPPARGAQDASLQDPGLADGGG